jgi:hypothetical protein
MGHKRNNKLKKSLTTMLESIEDIKMGSISIAQKVFLEMQMKPPFLKPLVLQEECSLKQ